jgi:MFS family permease
VVSRQLFLSLYLPATLMSLGQSMVAPVIPGFAKSFDVSLSTASLVFVAISAGMLAATFPAGYLMDRIGRRPVLLAGPMITAVASFMTPFSQSFVELLFWRFLIGVAMQLWQQARLAIIADTARHRHRARQLQWMMGVSRAGHLFGPAVGGFLAAGFGTAVPFVIHAALTLVAIVPSFKLIQETAPERRVQENDEEAATAVGWRPVIAYILTFQMIVFLLIQVTATLARGGFDHGSLNLYAVYAFGLGPEMLGLLATAALLFGIPTPFLTGYIMDRFGRRSVIVPGFLSFAFSLVLMSLTAFYDLPFWFFLATYVLVEATQGTTGGTMQVLGTDLSPRFGRGKFFAIWRTIAQLGATITPVVFAFIAEHAGYGMGFLYLAACAIAVAIGVGAVLGDTLARHDRADAEAEAARARGAGAN